MKAKFLSRKFLITLIVILIAVLKLEGGDLMTVLVTCLTAYSLGNVGEYFAESNKDKT